jgi:hypothetical protein
MLKRLLLCLLVSAPLSAQYIPVHAKLTDGTGNVSKTAYLHFELQGCGANFPIVPNNSQIVVQTAFDIKPNLMDGSILGQVIPNDLILCGNTSSTFWKVTPMKNSSQALTPAAGQLYQVCSNAAGCYPSGGTWEFSVAEPMNATLTAPSGSPFSILMGNPVWNQTWNQPIGTTGFFIGAFDFTRATVTGLTGGGGGGGTLTNIMTGPGLTGGPISSGSGTIGVAPGGIVNSMLATPFFGLTANGGLTGGGTVPLGGSTTLGIANGGVTNAMLASNSVSVTPAVGGGLAGGGNIPLGGSATLGLLSCGINQVEQFNGSAWACAANNSSPNQVVALLNQTSATLSVANTTTSVTWDCWDNATPANSVAPQTVTLNQTTFLVTIAFAIPQSGYCVINSSGSQGLGGTPSIAAGAGAGTGPTISLASGSRDTTGSISLTTGTSPSASSVIGTVSFAFSLPTAAFCTFAPANAASTALNVFISPNTGGFTLNAGTALGAGSSYAWTYQCKGY